MAGQADRTGADGPRVTILEEVQDYHYKRFSIWRARLQYRRSDGRLSDPVTRINFERGSAAALLLYDPAQDRVLMVRQFRYPVYASLTPEQRAGGQLARSWLLEIIAGVVEQGQTPEDVARREAQEETGYVVAGELQQIGEVFVSPGASSERVTIFLGQVDSRQRAGAGGGLAAEGEDTEIVWLPRADVLASLERGEIQDAKTVIALQYLAWRGRPGG